MKMVNKLRIFMILIAGLVSVNSSFAYDDIYASTKKGGKEYAQKAKKHSQEKADRNAKREEIENQRDMIIIKSPNVERYDLVSNEFIAVIDTTLKNGDAYMLDTIRIMDEFGDLEKTLMLKTKGKQNVYFDNGAIVIEDSASVAAGKYVTDTLISTGNGDYEYTKRLNKYHGTDYNVVSVENDNVAETSVTSSNTTVYVGTGWYPYHRYYGWYDYPFYSGLYYDPYWGYYDPYWGYYGYYRPYYYSYGCHYYHPYHHYYWSTPVYHHGHGGRYSASTNGTYGRNGVRVSRGESSSRSVSGTRRIERSSNVATTTSGRTTTLTRSSGTSSSRSSSTNTLRRSSTPTNSSTSSSRGSSYGSRSYSNGTSIRGNSSNSSNNYRGSSYSTPRSSSSPSAGRSSGSSSNRSSSYGGSSYGGSSRSGSSS